MPEPTAACFPPSSVFFFLLLNVPFGETTGGELTSTSQTFLHYNHHFSAWSRGKQKHRVKSRLEHQAWPISWFTTNKLEKSALMCLLTISSDVVGQTCSYTIWLTVIRRCQFKSLACDQCKRMHAFSWFQSSVTQAFPLLLCLLYFSAYAFCVCIKPARWIYIHLPRPSVLNLNQKAKGLFSILLRFDLVLFAMEFSYWTNLYVFKLGWSWSQTFKMLALL